jgi:acyl-CoA synthetase (AMP-forming)/AMP-acid ligase II
MTLLQTLVDVLDDSALRYPDRRLYFSSGRRPPREVTFQEIAEKSQRYGSALRRLGVVKGDIVGLLLGTEPEFVFSLLGTIRAGGVPVPLPTYSGVQSFSGFLERIAHILNHSGARYLIGRQSLYDAIHEHSGNAFLIGRRKLTPGDLDADSSEAAFPRISSEDLCLLQYTSGSTSAPKGVMLSHRNVLAGLEAIAHGIQVTAEDLWSTWLPLHHDMGLIGMLCGLRYGVSQHLSLARSFISRPGEWLDEFSTNGATGYTGPNFSYALMLRTVDDEQLARLDFSRWRIAFNGSEPIDPLVVEKFIERFSPAGFRREAMLPVYGLAEATLPVAFHSLGQELVIQWVDGKALAEDGLAVRVERSSSSAKGVVSVGTAVLCHQIRIVDSNGTELADNVVGEIQAAGPAVMAGYYSDPEQTAAALRDGWLSTGDLGYISEGRLFITGRAKEMIIVNGNKFYPQDVERLVASTTGIYQGRSVALGCTEGSAEYVVVAAETELVTEADKMALAEQIRTVVSNRLGLFGARICLLSRGAIPRTTSGKYQRLILKERLTSQPAEFWSIAREEGKHA